MQPDAFGLAVWAIHDAEREAKRARPAGDGFPSAEGAADVFAEVTVITDPARYVESALRNATDELAEMGEGGRNHALNEKAFTLGRLVGAELLSYETVEEALLDACDRNGLLSEDGSYACTATIRSGVRGGERDPLQWVQGERPADDPGDPFGTGLAPAPVPLDPQTGLPIVERTSWWPRDIAPVVRGDVDPEPPPAFLERSDARALFYAGKVNGLIGESESGKTWVALIAVAQTLKNECAVLYLDFEDTAAGIVGRLRSLGVSDDELGRLHYVSPDETFHANAERDLKETLAVYAPSLIILDGYNAAMTLLGLNLENNTEVTAFSMRVLRPMARTGACVVTIDHVTKSKDTRGNYAIGAQAKRADVDGCLIIVEVSQPFGRGQTGRLKLTVSKDRPGHVRSISQDGKAAGEAVLRSGQSGDITANITGPDLRPQVERGPFRPTVLMQRVSDFLQAMSEPATRTAVKDNVRGNNEHTLAALDLLIAEGYLRVNGGGRIVWLKQYRQDTDPLFDAEKMQTVPPSQDRPFPSQGTVAASVPSSPLPIGGREGRSAGASDGFPEDESVPSDDEPRERYK